MTRFARASGSKASNERREEEATPWHVMRQQLQEQSSNCDAESIVSLKQIVKNVISNQTKETNDIWCDFGESKQTKVKKKAKHILQSGATNVCNKPKPEQNHKTSSLNESIKEVQKSKNTKTKLTQKSKNTAKKTESNNATQVFAGKHKSSTVKESKPTNVKNNEKTYIRITNTKDNDQTVQKKNYLKNDSKIKNGSKTFHKTGHNLNDKPDKFADYLKSCLAYTIISNGREIKVVRYDGFLVKKDDAEKLKKLRKQLKLQNIPADKIKHIMKLERRKAEKALSREKNTVCFHCRKFGHNFADCPDIGKSETTTGICFKCGSTEHTHFQCKVTQKQNFRYALCFVCKEQGHIARQCKLNPQGQYPKGGSCHLCGEVTHLRKDCPKAIEETPSTKLLADRLNNRQVEDINEVQSISKNNNNHIKKKVVTF